MRYIRLQIVPVWSGQSASRFCYRLYSWTSAGLPTEIGHSWQISSQTNIPFVSTTNIEVLPYSILPQNAPHAQGLDLSRPMGGVKHLRLDDTCFPSKTEVWWSDCVAPPHLCF